MDCERALLWKIDLHLIPYLGVLYVVGSLCYNSIGNASIEGLVEDLNMTDRQYLWTLTAYFFPYALFNAPSNILLKKLKPSVWFPLIVIGWGICMTSTGFVNSFLGLLFCRLFLAAGQAGFLPGAAYYLSCWYRKREYGVRTALFFAIAILGGSFAGLLAALIVGLEQDKQKPSPQGLSRWAWIFIIEGIMALVAGIASIWLIRDFPDSAKFLTLEERMRVLVRLRNDLQLSAGRIEKLSAELVWKAASDWKTVVGMFIYMGTIAPIYAFTLFLPSIVKGLGYTSTKAQLLSAPPYFAACVSTVLAGWASDTFGRRGLCNVVSLIIAMVGYLMNLVPSAGARVRYAGFFLVGSGLYPAVSNTITWVANNVEGSYKRALVMAVMLSWGTLHGAVTANMYRAQDLPHYTLGHSVMLGYIAVSLLSTLVFWGASKRRIAGGPGARGRIVSTRELRRRLWN